MPVRERDLKSRPKKNQKNSKKLLTNSKLYGIIKTQKGKENPKHQKGIYYG